MEILVYNLIQDNPHIPVYLPNLLFLHMFFMALHRKAYFLSDYFLSELSERSEESPFLQHTGALAEILHFVQDDKKRKTG